MAEQQSDYRQIVKATSLFGGVQIFQIVIQVVRSKFIAILLGPNGMGIAGLLFSTTNLINSITGFGLGTSAVKDIAAASGTNDNGHIARVIKVLRNLVWLTGTLGALVTLILSPWLSTITFGNRDYTMGFIWLSVTLLFNQLTTGQTALLQGMRKLQYLAKANLTGSALGLIFTVPLYYIWGIKGIVPGMIVTSLLSLLASWYYSNKVRVEKTKVSFSDTVNIGKNIITLGFMISLSGLTSIGAAYLVRIFIRITGGVDQVGLYNAGFTIINTYVGLVFTAMATEYYPRLSSAAGDNKLSRQIINQQAEIVLLVLAPILLVFLVFIKWVVIILYSNSFTAINEMIYWAALGMFFKAASWSIAFILLAKGAGRLFFLNELIGNLNLLILNIAGYHLFGLTGLGISFLCGFFLYLCQVFFISRKKYEFSFDKAFLRIFGIQFILAIASFIAVNLLERPWSYIPGVILITFSVIYSYKELDKRIAIKSVILGVKEKIGLK
jgi:O-antigen/teichoic acid export membrane protein